MGINVDASVTPLLRLVPQIHDVVLESMGDVTKIAGVGSLTLDGWSSSRNRQILGITLHTINQNWQLQTHPVGLIDTKEQAHSAMNIAAAVTARLETTRGVSSNLLVFAATTDGAKNMLLATRTAFSAPSSVQCMVHAISLIVKTDVLNSTGTAPFYATLLDHLHDIAVKFQQHPKFAALLQKQQLLADVTLDRLQSLQKYNETRWHSRLACAERYVSLHDKLNETYDAIKNDKTLGAIDNLPKLLNHREMILLADAIIVLQEVCINLQMHILFLNKTQYFHQ